MNPLINKTLLLALIFIGFVSEAQIKRYSFKTAANYPLINAGKSSSQVYTIVPVTSGTVVYSNVGTIKQSFSEYIGFDAGGCLDFTLSGKFFLTTGLSVSYLRFKKIITIENLSEYSQIKLPSDLIVIGRAGSSVGVFYSNITYRDGNGNLVTQPYVVQQGDKVGETTTLYLQVPVLAGIALLEDKLLLRAGVTFSYLLNATNYKTEASYDGSSFSTSDVKYATRDGYTHLLVSATIQATYLLTNRIGIDFSANKYLSPIYSNTNQDKKAKYNALSLGLSYNLSQ